MNEISKLVFDELSTAYKGLEGPLKDAENANETRAARRREIGGVLEVNEAKIAVLSRKIEELLARSEFTEAGVLKAERDGIQAETTALYGESATLLDEIAREKEAIHIGRERLARDVLSKVYPSIQRMAHEALERAMDTIHGAWLGLQSFEQSTAPCLSISTHQHGLIPSEASGDPKQKKLCRDLVQWLG